MANFKVSTLLTLVGLHALCAAALPRSVVPPSGSSINVGCWPGYICFDSNWNRVVDRVCGSDAGDRCVPQEQAPELHLTSPTSYSAPLANTHNLTRPSGICQVRLDFLRFDLAQPDTGGDCATDFFKISGADNLNGFVTCGHGVGQHLFLQYGVCDTILVNVLLGKSDSSYDILVTYLPCNGASPEVPEDPQSSTTEQPETTVAETDYPWSEAPYPARHAKFQQEAPEDLHGIHSVQKTESQTVVGSNDNSLQLAPEGCAQYFTQPFGTISSFNFNPSGDGSSNHQLNHQRYCSCIKNFPGSSQVTFRPCTNSSFFISRSGGDGSLTGNNCPTDYIDIPGSQNGRYCGSGFPVSGVTSSLRPHVMCVNFDESEFPGADLPFDPETNCQLGFDCISDGSNGGIPGFQPPGTYCDHGQGMFCVPGAVLGSQLDSGNTGFCLQYQVT